MVGSDSVVYRRALGGCIDIVLIVWEWRKADVRFPSLISVQPTVVRGNPS
jgi:hypothetical protein